MLTYQQAKNLKKGDRLKVLGINGWITGTLEGKGTVSGSPVLWIDEDDNRKRISTAHYISTDLNEYGWNKLNAGHRYVLLVEQSNLFDMVN